MKQIEQTYEIKAPINKVWGALVDLEVIAEWGGGPAEMTASEGVEFSLWGARFTAPTPGSLKTACWSKIGIAVNGKVPRRSLFIWNRAAPAHESDLPRQIFPMKTSKTLLTAGRTTILDC
jgi:hypothetical protein